MHVAAGRVFAAIADLRPDSATAGTVWTGTLDRANALFVSAGLGNVFQAVSEVAVYAYLVDRHWSPDADYPSVAWDDPISPCRDRSPTMPRALGQGPSNPA